MFSRSARCARALFDRPSHGSEHDPVKSLEGVKAERNIYRLEHAAFAAFALAEPSKWKSNINWPIGLIYFIYLAPIAMGLSSSSVDSARGYWNFPFPILCILGILAVWQAIVRTYAWRRRIRTCQAIRDTPEPELALILQSLAKKFNFPETSLVREQIPPKASDPPEAVPKE
jgi:hypothetical protein